MEKTNGAGQRAARRLDNGILFRRWMGCWIDFVVVILLLGLSAAPWAGRGGQPSDDELAVFGLVAVGVVVGYYTLAEGLAGRTLGKLISGTIVVNAAGERPGVGRALVRTLLRIFEVNPFLLGGLPAAIAVIATHDKQRLGDLLAGTYVVPVKVLAATPRTAPSVAAVFD